MMSWARNTIRAQENLDMLKNTYYMLYNQSREFLNADETVEAFGEKWKDPASMRFSYAFNRFNNASIISNRFILTDTEGKLMESDFSEEELSDYLLNYNRAVCYNAGNQESDEIYVSVYFDTGKYSDYMFVKPVYSNDALKGYISLFILGEAWNYYLSDRNYDGVIIDNRNNVIYRSKAGFANQSGKFEPVNKTISIYNNERYWQRREHLPECGVTVYSLVYYPKDNAVWIGAAILVVTGFLWYHIANQMSCTMAAYNAENIAKLVTEIRMIQDGAHGHRIYMDTEDEFAEVAHRINRMLDSVQELNSRNADLLILNSTLEMRQLEAQMNPHFLYNTLEIIRNLVFMDAQKAELLIEKLVQILRYSVNSSCREVYLREDLEYINGYLYIQKMRYGERLRYSIKLSEECLDCIIPKLLLQPLIENSIKYGFRKKMEIEIKITGEVVDHILFLRVKDDGGGMTEERAIWLGESLRRVDHRDKSLGIHNIARRLRLQYGERSGLQFVNHEGNGLEILLKIEQKTKDER